MENPEYEVVGVTRDLSSLDTIDSEPDFLEFQIDTAENPLDQLQSYNGGIPLIVSWSSQGSADGASADDSTIIEAVKHESVEMVDMLLEDLEYSNTLTVELESADVDIIATYYNSDETPSKDELVYHIEECADVGDISKIITFSNNSDDSLHFFEALNSASKSGLRVTGYCLGDASKHTRTMGVFYGSKFCYGVIDPEMIEDDAGGIELERLLETLDTTIHGGDDVELMDALKGKFS